MPYLTRPWCAHYFLPLLYIVAYRYTLVRSLGKGPHIDSPLGSQSYYKATMSCPIPSSPLSACLPNYSVTVTAQVSILPSGIACPLPVIKPFLSP